LTEISSLAGGSAGPLSPGEGYSVIVQEPMANETGLDEKLRKKVRR